MRSRGYCLMLVASAGAIAYGFVFDDVRGVVFGFLAILAFLGLLHGVRLVRRNLAAVEEMRGKGRERDWQWPDREAA